MSATTKRPPTPATLGVQHREVIIARDAIADAGRASADDRLPVALSSELPVERWFGMEILDHSAAAVDLSRAAGGLPLLLDHDQREQIGVIEDVAIGRDKVLRGRMRFSKSARAQEIRQDVLDGIRTRASIGYQVRDLVLEERQQGAPETWRATRWMPMEGSLVSIPADPTVGVGRSAPDVTAPTQERTVMTATASAPTAPDSRAEELQELAGLARLHDATDLLPGWLERGAGLDEARAEVLDRVRQRGGYNPPRNANPSMRDWNEMDQGLGRYRFTRALLDAAEGKNGPEAERTQQLAKELKRSVSKHTILLPVGELATRVMTTGGVGSGKEFVFQQHVGHIEPLRNAMRVAQLGATVLSSLQGNADFTKQTSDVSLQWMGENPGSSVTPSDITTALVSLRPKTAMAQHEYTRQQLTQGTPEMESLARNSFIATHALGLDKAAIQGTGSSNQPTGILNTSGISSVAIGTNGGAPTYEHMVDLVTAVKTANGVTGPLGFLSTPGIEGKLRKTQEFATTNGVAVWRGGDQGEVAGYPAYSSNQVPSALTKGTSSDCHAIICGAWQDLVMGLWGVLEIIVDPYTKAGKGIIVLTSFQMVDIAVRNTAAFAAIVDARTV